MDAIPDWLIQIIPQAGLVLLFMWYQDRAEQRRIKLETDIEDKRIQAAIKNHEEWRVFMRERDLAFNAGLGRIAEEVKQATQGIIANTTLLIAHDTRSIANEARSAETTGDIRRIRERLAQAGIGNVEESPVPAGKK